MNSKWMTNCVMCVWWFFFLLWPLLDQSSFHFCVRINVLIVQKDRKKKQHDTKSPRGVQFKKKKIKKKVGKMHKHLKQMCTNRRRPFKNGIYYSYDKRCTRMLVQKRRREKTTNKQTAIHIHREIYAKMHTNIIDGVSHYFAI